jgi:transcriptional regulator with XRE-family HTH domain
VSSEADSDGDVTGQALVARELRHHRERAGLNLSQLAKRVGYSRTYISTSEKPGADLVSEEVVRRIDQELDAGGELIELRARADADRKARRAPAADVVPRQADFEGGTFSGISWSSGRRRRLVVGSSAHLDEIMAHLREQWHALVRTDNLLGPRFAISGVLNQIAVIEELCSNLRGQQRLEIVRLGSQYAESAAWLYEDACDIGQAHYWTSRAMEWAYEGDDGRMLAWTIFRRSQQAAAALDAAQAIGFAQAARRNEERLARPTRAAIRVQEACGYALDGDENAAQTLLDEAHTWAASDSAGDAHEGHGSYCTPSYIEIQRANCWLTAGKPKKAIVLYEKSLRTLPVVYQRSRAAALSRLAVACIADGQFEQAASAAHAALPVARSGGSVRIVEEVKSIGRDLTPHRKLQGVAALLDDLGSGEEA